MEIFFAIFQTGKRILFGLLVWKKKISRLDLVTYIFIIFYSRLIQLYLYRVKYDSARPATREGKCPPEKFSPPVGNS